MKSVKNYVQSAVPVDRLSDWSLLSTEANLGWQMDFEDVINDFLVLKSSKSGYGLK